MMFRNTLTKRFTSQLIQPLKITPPTAHSLSFTAPAIKRLSALAQMGDSLKIKVSSGGCHGYQYDLHLIKTADLHTPSDDPLVFFTLPFIKPSPGDITSTAKTFNDFKNTNTETQNTNVKEVVVSIDDLSLELLDKTTLDFKQELIGSQFKIIGGNMKSSCGCGSSFDI